MPDRFTHLQLKCALTRQELAQATIELRRIEVEKGQVMAGYNAKIKELQGRTESLAGTVNQGFEFRSVECQLMPDYSEHSISTMRLDTGEFVEVRAMREEELQTNLELVPPAPPGEDARCECWENHGVADVTEASCGCACHREPLPPTDESRWVPKEPVTDPEQATTETKSPTI